MAGIDEAGGSSGTAGAGGAPEPPDLCVGKMCNTPPAGDCLSPTSFQTYDSVGSCSAGVCSYASHQIACTCQSQACTTDPCVGVTCASPPAAICKDANTATTYAASGTCGAGSCSYKPMDTSCAYGCASGACKPNPCVGVTCTSAPASTCKNATTQTTYASPGTCSSGTCNYTPTDTGCGANKACAGAGVCSVCKADTSCGSTCAACGASTPKCKDLGTTSQCVGCLSNADCSGATPVCSASNACVARPSCTNLAATCGPNGNADCCASNVVTGGTFNRGNDATYPASVSDFRLDTYEVTVGRYRKFVAVYSPTLIGKGAGANPNNMSDPGWSPEWNGDLELYGVAPNCPGGTWADAPGSAGAESLPINCVDWFQAEAFCTWDGGRLPTEAEWNYAAAGGTQQLVYPWGSAAPNCSYANFYDSAPCVGVPSASTNGDLNRVGSESPKGDGPYHQADLEGNVAEWVQDWYASPYLKPCADCANLTSSVDRVIRGAGVGESASNLLSYYRGSDDPTDTYYGIGVRCARPR
jgi:sulfatase modifying factor 1